MSGSGVPYKPFHINQGDEAVAFGTEAAAYYAVPGPIEDLPTLNPHNEELTVTKHSEPGAYHKVLKGGEVSSISIPYSGIENFRFMAHLLQNRIERARMLKLDGTPATIVAGNTITDETTGETSVIDAITGDNVTLLQFQKDETLNFSPSSAVGVLLQIKGNVMIITVTSGTVAANDVALGATSGAKTKISTINSTTNFTLFDWGVGNEITEDTGNNAISTIITQHQLAFNNNKDQESKSMEYSFDGLPDIHLLLGDVLDKVEITSAWQQVPKSTHDWRVSSVTEVTRTSTEQSNTATDLYVFTDIDCTVNSVDVTALFQTVTTSFEKSYEGTPSHDTLLFKGFTSVSLLSTIKIGIWREDSTLLALRTADTNFPFVLTWTRGTAGEDDAVLTYPTCKSLKPSESADKNKIMNELDIQIEGTPTMVIHDQITNYN